MKSAPFHLHAGSRSRALDTWDWDGAAHLQVSNAKHNHWMTLELSLFFPMLRTGNSWGPQISLLVNADLLMVTKNPVQSPLKAIEKVSPDFSDLWMSL